MKLTILGKYGPYPLVNGATSGYLVRSDKTCILLECGSGILSRAQNYVNLRDIDAIVLSHLHYDHISDVLPFSYYLQNADEPIDVICPVEPDENFSVLADCGTFCVTEAKGKMTIGDMKIEFIPMTHSVVSNAVKITSGGKTLFYSGDTSFNENILSVAKGSDLLLLDCGCAENSSAPHLKLSEASFIARKLKIPTIATHLHPKVKYRSNTKFLTIAQEMTTHKI